MRNVFSEITKKSITLSSPRQNLYTVRRLRLTRRNCGRPSTQVLGRVIHRQVRGSEHAAGWLDHVSDRRRRAEAVAEWRGNRGIVQRCGGVGRGLAVELAPIRVNTTAPGLINTPLHNNMTGKSAAERFPDIAKRLPVKRMG
jgi:hypothetical protein